MSLIALLEKELTPIEYSLLSSLVQRPGEALSLEYLLTKVWGKEYDTFDLVKWHISSLRKRIRNGYHESRHDGPSPIVTVRGYGTATKGHCLSQAALTRVDRSFLLRSVTPKSLLSNAK